MGLHDGRLAIDIDDESRQQVALAMHKTVGVVIRIVGNADGLAHFQRRTEARGPEAGIDGYIAKRQHTDGNRTGLIVSDSDEITLTGDHTYDIALTDAVVGMLNGP